MDPTKTAICACLAIAVLAAAWDLATRTIPNVLTLGGIALGLALHGGVGYVNGGFHAAIQGIGASLAGVAICAAFPVLSFALKQMGGGDVKLFAAIGAICGPVVGFDAQAFTFVVLAAVVLPFRLLRHRAVRATLREGLAFAKVKLPPVVMAPSILAGLCASVLRHRILP